MFVLMKPCSITKYLSNEKNQITDEKHQILREHTRGDQPMTLWMKLEDEDADAGDAEFMHKVRPGLVVVAHGRALGLSARSQPGSPSG